MNWYCSREAVKLAVGLQGPGLHPRIDRAIRMASDEITNSFRRYFIPRTETRLFHWPQKDGRGDILYLDRGLLAVTTLQSKAQDSSPTTISSSDYFLEPNNSGPPYSRVEIDLSSTAIFQGGDTPQRSISVLGRWGYSEDTEVAGTVGSGLSSSSSATSMVCSDGGKIDVGDTLLIESEQIFVTERENAAESNGDLLTGALTNALTVVTVGVDSGSRYTAGEIIQVNSERMLIESISSNNLTVKRGHEGTLPAAHADDDPVHVVRTLTIVRGVNGTTAATHANATAITRYTPEPQIVTLATALALATLAQETASWGRTIGQGEGAIPYTGAALKDFKATVTAKYRRRHLGA
jgi:hypothetical protein